MSQPHPLPTRTAGLDRLTAFLPLAGAAYARNRNHDLPNQSHVSGLGPYLRHRMVTEKEVVRAVLGAHGAPQAVKFIDEVYWRSYWKGWLELRPGIWTDYRKALSAALDQVKTQDGLRRSWEEACNGQTGIDGFDDWARQLVATGYLHNHARMWFASIWLFTLKLPWQLGADFFYRHLLDGDPASNTCSWRWVGGLHTPGKHYVARASNIGKYTNGRFNPAGLLASDPLPLGGEDNPARRPLTAPPGISPGRPSLLVLHEDELSIAHLPVDEWNIKGVLIADLLERRSLCPVGHAVRQHVTGLIADCHADIRTRLGLTASVATSLDDLASHARACGAEQVIMPCVPAGHTADAMADLPRTLAVAGIGLGVYRHAYDAVTWPHAGGGFFKLKSLLPAIIDRLGLKP